jgi:hypothetical protein
MSIKYSDTPQVHYGKQRPAANNWRERFPPEAQPIRSAPTNSVTPVEIYEANGQGWLALHHKGRWNKLCEEFDDRTGKTSISMNGETVDNPVMWAYHRKR